MADPDLQINGAAGEGGGGGRLSRPRDKGEGAISQKNFSALWASVWSENKRGAGAGLSPGSATASPRWTVGAGPKGVCLQES